MTSSTGHGIARASIPAPSPKLATAVRDHGLAPAEGRTEAEVDVRFLNKVVIVTGAGSGIGRATALAFCHAGAHVLGIGRRASALEDTARLHPSFRFLVADIATTESTGVEIVDGVVEYARDVWGRIDVVINNAGMYVKSPLTEACRPIVERLFAINVTAPALLVGAALPELKKSRGCVVNVSSTFGQRALAGSSHYGASKAALEQFTRSWALELAPDGVRVNAVAPGPTETEVLVSAGLSPDAVAKANAANATRIPLGRLGQPADIAYWILALADPAGGWVTGQVIAVDGGLALV